MTAATPTALPGAEDALRALKWRPFRVRSDVPTDGTWFVARSTVPGWSATRVVHYASPTDRLPIDHSDWMWPSEPSEWMPLSEYAAALQSPRASDEVPGEASGVASNFEAALRRIGAQIDSGEAAGAVTRTIDGKRYVVIPYDTYEGDLMRRFERGKAYALSASPVPVDASGALLAWFSDQHRLELTHYSPVYGDDDDQSVEWRVHKQGGSINDREWDLVGSGETALAAIQAAYNALSHTAPVADAQAGEGK